MSLKTTTMAGTTTTENPKELLGKKLLALKKDITTSDREAYDKAFPITPENLSVYLNGKGTDVEKAMQMVEFFQNRINARLEKINDLVK